MCKPNMFTLTASGDMFLFPEFFTKQGKPQSDGKVVNILKRNADEKFALMLQQQKTNFLQQTTYANRCDKILSRLRRL